MAGIPPSLDTDTEDVAWALQTAEALWKRNERQDAIVWLRRAAQAAGDAQDDDRALALARNAAELAEWVNRQAAQSPSVRTAARRSGAPPARVAPAPPPPPIDADVESVQVQAEEEEATSPRVAFSPVMSFPSAVMTLPLPPPMSPTQTVSTAPAPPVVPPAPPAVPSLASVGARPPPPPAAVPLRSPPPPPPPTAAPRSPAAMPVAAPVVSRLSSPPPPPPGPPVTLTAPARLPSPPPPALTSEVPTAAEAHAGILDPWADAPDDRGPQRTPHDGVRRARERPGFDADEIVTSAPPVAKPQAKGPPPADRPLQADRSAQGDRLPAPPAQRAVPPQPPTTPRAIPEPPSSPRGGVSDTGGLDLSSVDALSDLPDDARRAFSRRAKVRDLVRRDEVSDFALALVLDGRVEVAATLVDSPAMRLEAGAVLRARGTIEAVAPLRLIAASDTCRIALWSERDVAEAFRSCPWVEDELRVAGNQTQAMVGVTLGALGERLDPLLRTNVTDRMRLRVLGDHEVFAKAGNAIPGLLVVGGGELELVGKDGTPTGTILRAGDFLFPNEVLRAAPAPWSVRAARGGAIILVAERGVAQELLVTCPPLLEIFASA